MKLITNRISTGNARSFEDFVADFKKKNQIKTASVKTAEQDEADSSGQLDVEPLHQKGESTTMPKAGPSAKKDDGEKAAANTTQPDEEGKDSGQSKAEGSEKFTNDPEVPSKEEKGGSTEISTKVARNRDGTGPDGDGPRTGRGLGDCPDDDDEDDEADEKKKKGKKETVDIAIDRLLNIQEADVTKIIGDLVDTDLGGSNKDQGKFVSLLKGLAFSDDPKANEFMKGMDKAATTVGKKVLG